MKRQILRILACLSLLLAILTTILWIRSHYLIDAYGWATPTGTRSIASNIGGLNLVSWTNPPDGSFSISPTLGFLSTPATGRPSNVPPTHSFAGFQYTHRSFSGLILRHIRIPFYSLLLLFLPLPLLYLYKSLRHPHDPTLCPKCGYDLRASPDRCPECGASRPSTPSTFGVQP